MTKTRSFPYLPKSVLSMMRGDFWAIPLSNSTFACGRVLQLGSEIQPRLLKAFWGCVLDWNSPDLPNHDNIAGAKSIREGSMHILAIESTGGAILGSRSLALDGLAPSETVAAGLIYRGFGIIRPAANADYENLQSHSAWGLSFAEVLAEKWFVGGDSAGLKSKAINPFEVCKK